MLQCPQAVPRLCSARPISQAEMEGKVRGGVVCSKLEPKDGARQGCSSITQNSRSSQATQTLTVAKTKGMWVNFTMCHRNVTSNTSIICFFTHLISLPQLQAAACGYMSPLGFFWDGNVGDGSLLSHSGACCIFPPCQVQHLLSQRSRSGGGFAHL